MSVKDIKGREGCLREGTPKLLLQLSIRKNPTMHKLQTYQRSCTYVLKAARLLRPALRSQLHVMLVRCNTYLEADEVSGSTQACPI